MTLPTSRNTNYTIDATAFGSAPTVYRVEVDVDSL
jgi:hypothetical protein